MAGDRRGWGLGKEVPLKRANALLLRRFPQQNVRRTQFEVEDALRAYVGSDAVAQPVHPGNPLRYSMMGKRAQVQVADNMVSMALAFPTIPQSGLMQPLQRAAAEMDKLDAVFGNQPIMFRAVAVSFAYVADKATLISVFDKISDEVLQNPIHNLEAISFTLAERVGDIHHVVELGQFASATFAAVPNTDNLIDFDFIPKTEEGIGFKVEVNTKPLTDSGGGGVVFSSLLGDWASAISGIGKTATGVDLTGDL